MKKLSRHQGSVIGPMLSSKSNIVQLTGAGGTGKSFCVAEIVQDAIKARKKVILTGTTHRAVKNLEDMLPKNIRVETATIHSVLGFIMAQDGGGGEFLTRRAKFQGVPPMDMLIIDESSMLSEQLLKAIKAEHIPKVILVGDAVQLTLPGTANLSKVPVFELTEQMRQKDTPNVKKALLDLRKLIKSKASTDMGGVGEGKDLKVFHDHVDFLKAYKKSKSSKIILAYQNRTVKSYNTNIKKYLHGQDEDYSIGDIIYPTSPIIMPDGKGGSNITVKNRTLGIILDIIETEHDYTLITDAGTMYTAKNKGQLREAIDNFAETKEWQKLYALKGKYADIHHTYAGTTHSAQGMSIDEVWIDYTDLEKILEHGTNEDLNRILYVAMSRCIKKVNIFVGNERVYKALGNYTPRKDKDV